MVKLGLPMVPVGTLIALYLLYLFLSQKGRTVLSTDYRGVIERTPDIRYRTSPLVWAVGGTIALLFALALLVPALQGS